MFEVNANSYWNIILVRLMLTGIGKNIGQANELWSVANLLIVQILFKIHARKNLQTLKISYKHICTMFLILEVSIVTFRLFPKF